MYLVREGSYKTDNPLYLDLQKAFPKVYKYNDIPDLRAKGHLLLHPYTNIDPEETVLKLYEKGFPQKPLMNWCLENLTQSDKSFLDIGAHIGSFTLTQAGKAKHTYAFECGSKAFYALAGNVGIHELYNKVSVFNLALGNPNEPSLVPYYTRNESGTLNGIKPFRNEGKTNLFTSANKYKVWVYKLDEIKALQNVQDIGWIRLDVNGSEKDVIEGGLETLKRNGYPKIIFESENGKEANTLYASEAEAMQSRKELFKLLEDIGYRIITLKGDKESFLATKD